MCGCRSLGSIGREDADLFFFESPQPILKHKLWLRFLKGAMTGCEDTIAPQKGRKVGEGKGVPSEVTRNMIAERVQRAVTVWILEEQ